MNVAAVTLFALFPSFVLAQTCSGSTVFCTILRNDRQLCLDANCEYVESNGRVRSSVLTKFVFDHIILTTFWQCESPVPSPRCS